MRKNLILGVVIFVATGLFLTAGCVKKAASVSEAIQNSQSLKNAKEQANYLIQQAKQFYNSQEFQQAIDVAQYVLSKLDNNSSVAKDLIESAKAKLQAAAQKAAGDMQNKLFGK